MNRRLLTTVIGLGLLYAVIGVVSSALAGAAGSVPLRTFWRVAAFVVSAAIFAINLVQERVHRQHTTPRSAWHVALAVACGAFLLALVVNLHDLGSGAPLRPRMLFALITWPLVTAVPAFLVALAMAAVLGARRPR